MARRGANTFIHPLAQIDPDSFVGKGTKVWQYTIIKEGARIGENCNIGSHCYVEGGASVGNNVTVKNGVALWEGVHLADGVFVGPYAIFTNDAYPRSPRAPEAKQRYRDRQKVILKTSVEYGATIGGGAMILAGISVGKFATVGLGAVVTQAVLPYALVVGNPARQVGWMCECGYPLAASKKTFECKECSRQYKEMKKQLMRIS
jgi:UDP-2-acetamido-3-amino-2,3-dideoxy-glucuronate N-acetyltransferase